MSKSYVEKRAEGYWVADTRVSLDSVVYAFLNGQTAESITEDPGLRERMNWGDIEDQSFAEFAAQWERCSRERDYRPSVGDRLDNDIGPAKLQGWHTIRVLQGFSRFQKPRCAGEVPDLELASIREMPVNKPLQRALTGS